MELRKKLALVVYALCCFVAVGLITFADIIWLKILGWLFVSLALTAGGVLLVLARFAIDKS
jgi:hypothetical protein